MEIKPGDMINQSGALYRVIAINADVCELEPLQKKTAQNVFVPLGFLSQLKRETWWRN